MKPEDVVVGMAELRVSPAGAGEQLLRPFDLVDCEVLVGKIFCHLAPKTLVRAGLVCKEWKVASGSDELWATLQDKVLVHRLKMHGQREGELFFRAYFNPEAASTLSVKEIKKVRQHLRRWPHDIVVVL